MMFPMIRTNGRNLFPTFETFAELSRDVNRLLGGSATCTPMPVDIREEGDALVLQADVPGVSQSELEITVENDALKISVNRAAPTEESVNNYLVRERRAGNVARAFTLPEMADLDKVEAGLANGVLTLRVPKKEQPKPRQIPVK